MLGALLATTAPGTNVQIFPQGTALRVRAGSVVTFQMHYTAHGDHAVTDRTSVGLVFAKAPPSEEIRASSFSNGQFRIPVGAPDFPVPAEVGFREDVRIWGSFHTRTCAESAGIPLVRPDGSSEVILSVPTYRFQLADVITCSRIRSRCRRDGRSKASPGTTTPRRTDNPDPAKVR